ncbi:MAG: hypothetical protein J6D53_01495 [Blautia sp.]|nr:hypothetical protein [Blautia sp.]
MLIAPIIKILLLSLAATLLVELAAAYFMKVSVRDLSVVALVNLMTNPPYVLFILVCRYFFSPQAILILQIVCEIIIIVIEAKLYRAHLKSYSRPYTLSIIANLLSITAGAALSHIMF